MLPHMLLKPLLLATISIALLNGCGGGGGGDGGSGSGSVGAGAGVTTVSTFVTDADLSGSRHIAFSGSDLYVAVDVPASASDKVLKFDSAGVKTTLVPSGTFSGITSPFGIAASGSDVYVAGTVAASQRLYLVANGSPAAGLPTCNCYGIAYDGTNLSYADQSTQSVYTYRGGALYRTNLVNFKPTGLVFHNSDLYVTRFDATTTGAIQKIDLANNSVANFAGSSLFNNPNAITVDPATGNFYVVNDGDGKVLKISGGNVTVHLDSSHGLNSPGGVAVGNGFLYVSNNGFILKASL
jgi:DNA-binding beta-propeller fold protein YncE